MRFKGSRADKEITKFEKEIALKEIDGVTDSKLDLNLFYENFMETDTTSHSTVDENANVTDNSIISYYIEAPKALYKKAAMDWIKDNVGSRHHKAIKEGFLYINDLGQFFKPYCYAFDSVNYVLKGIDFVPLTIRPPKHASTYIDLHVQGTATISNMIAGGISYPSLLVYLDWYLRNEMGEVYSKTKKAVKYIEQIFQSMIYGFNYSFRGSQSAFVTMSIYDKYFMEDLFKDTVYPDGTKANLDSIDYLQKWFAEYFIELNNTDQPMTFPVLTVAMVKEDGVVKDQEFLTWVAKNNLTSGIFNIYAGELGNLSSCCRLRNDSKVFTNMLGTPSLSIGSTRVATLNLPQIVEEAKSFSGFITLMQDYYAKSIEILMAHRNELSRAIKMGKHPLYTKGWISLQRQFCTIGYIGMYEAVVRAIEKFELTEGFEELAKTILSRLNNWNEASTLVHGCMFNVEQIPGESAGVSLAKKTNFLYKTDYTIFSNQYTPLVKSEDILKRIETHGKLDALNGGGAILHLNIEEQIVDTEVMKKLIEYTVSTGVIYFAVNYNIAVCDECRKIHIGKFDKTPCCMATATNYLRIVGYLRPVTSWAKARQVEYTDRQFYNNTQEEFKNG